MTLVILTMAEYLRVSFLIRRQDLEYVNNCACCDCCSCFLNRALGCRVSNLTVRLDEKQQKDQDFSRIDPLLLKSTDFKEPTKAKDAATQTEDVTYDPIKLDSQSR